MPQSVQSQQPNVLGRPRVRVVGDQPSPGSRAGIGVRLATARRAIGWTQAALAHFLAVRLDRADPFSQTTISEWERGRLVIPENIVPVLEDLLRVALLTPIEVTGRKGEGEGQPASDGMN